MSRESRGPIRLGLSVPPSPDGGDGTLIMVGRWLWLAEESVNLTASRLFKF